MHIMVILQHKKCNKFKEMSINYCGSYFVHCTILFIPESFALLLSDLIYPPRNLLIFLFFPVKGNEAYDTNSVHLVCVPSLLITFESLWKLCHCNPPPPAICNSLPPNISYVRVIPSSSCCVKSKNVVWWWIYIKYTILFW